MALEQQAQGVGFVTKYITVTFAGIDIRNIYDTALVLYAALLISSFGAFYFLDKVWRRTPLIIGSVLCTIWMGIVGVIAAAFETLRGDYGNTLVAPLFIRMACFSNSWSIVPWTNASEISSNPLRERLLPFFPPSAALLWVSLSGVPYIQNPQYSKLGGKVAFIWMGFFIIS